MKHFLLIISIIAFLCATCQNRNQILTYFPDLEDDSAFYTEKEEKVYFEKYQEIKIPDSIALKYFFNNNYSKMKGIEEGYNVDDHTYSEVSYIKRVNPIFKRRKGGTILLCYAIKSVFYLSLYDEPKNRISNTFVFADFSEDVGDEVTHSIIFRNNLIVTLEYRDKVYCKLTKIDFKNHKFIEIKKLAANEGIDFKEALPILGINENGELLKD